METWPFDFTIQIEINFQNAHNFAKLFSETERDKMYCRKHNDILEYKIISVFDYAFGRSLFYFIIKL